MARPRRLPAFDYRGSYVYSLTFCTHRRRRFFEHEAIVHQVRLAIDSAATHAFAVLAYTFMPDHVHLLVQGLGDESCLPSFVKLARQRGSVATRGLRDAPLWQDGYFERTLRRDEDVVSVARYLAANPVRAGLVDEAGDWPHSGGVILDALLERR